SPKRFLQFLTTTYLKQRLQQFRSIEEAAADAGLSSQSRVYDLFTTLEAVTPGEYRERGLGIHIQYGFHPTPFGICLIGVTDRGICWLSFVSADQERRQALEEMKIFWHNSVFHEDRELTATFINRIFQHPGREKLHLFVK